MIGEFHPGTAIDLLPEYPDVLLVARRHLLLDTSFNVVWLHHFGFTTDDFRSVHYRKTLTTHLVRSRLVAWVRRS